MKTIRKHTFEPVSLLTVENGILELAVIPAQNQPNWIVPKSLILGIETFQEQIWTYLWDNQEVAVYQLIPSDEVADKIIILEGNTAVHRIALQTAGDIVDKNVRISDVKDVDLPTDVIDQMMKSIPKLTETGDALEYLYQAVAIDGEYYLVPDLDVIAHRLVDLDD